MCHMWLYVSYNNVTCKAFFFNGFWHACSSFSLPSCASCSGLNSAEWNRLKPEYSAPGSSDLRRKIDYTGLCIVYTK